MCLSSSGNTFGSIERFEKKQSMCIYTIISIYIYVWLGAMDGLERGVWKGRRVAFHLFTLFHVFLVSCIVSFRFLFLHLSILFPALFLSFVSCIEDDAVAQDVPIDRHLPSNGFLVTFWGTHLRGAGASGPSKPRKCILLLRWQSEWTTRMWRRLSKTA